MAYTILPEPGESVHANIELWVSKKAQPFFFAVSNRAVYTSKQKIAQTFQTLVEAFEKVSAPIMTSEGAKFIDSHEA